MKSKALVLLGSIMLVAVGLMTVFPEPKSMEYLLDNIGVLLFLTGFRSQSSF